MLSNFLRKKALPFEYHIRYSKRKTLGIYVSSGVVEVRAPVGAAHKWIDSFVREKADWIEAKLVQQQGKAQEAFRLEDEADITVLGELYQIRVVQGRKNSVDCEPGFLTFTVRDGFSPLSTVTLEPLFSRWLRNLATDYMVPKAVEFAEALGVRQRLQNVRFRRTKTKWGHCSNRGVIQFNWLIMLAPAEVVEYLIVHEVCHLVHLNHSAAYWALVATLCPDYRQRRKWLRDNEHRYRIIGL
ncbi:MAG: M48 family metallopeptidase [Hahellaceae bacterium]|nr:M48 family metallopeptidase [Hahellaceae bacterium]MCP5210871.1 M48 family metallopeptidase [Hahellaceae bacterium]